jgi:hypothetical protein
MRPVSYFSKRLTAQQQKYHTSERELLAIVLAIEYFKQFLYGKHFVILSDHQPLRTILTAEELSSRLSRWLVRLQIFDFTIVYRPGNKHNNADALSRLSIEDTTSMEVDEDDDVPVRINSVHSILFTQDLSEVTTNLIKSALVEPPKIFAIHLRATQVDDEQLLDEDIN